MLKTFIVEKAHLYFEVLVQKFSNDFRCSKRSNRLQNFKADF